MHENQNTVFITDQAKCRILFTSAFKIASLYFLPGLDRFIEVVIVIQLGQEESG
jgi:hypothetical protein